MSWLGTGIARTVPGDDGRTATSYATRHRGLRLRHRRGEPAARRGGLRGHRRRRHPRVPGRSGLRDGDLTFRLNFPDDSDTAPREAEQLQDTWNQVGVAVQIQGFDPDTLTSLCCPGFDFDVIIWSWYTDIDAGGLLGVATCAEIPSGLQRDRVLQPGVRRAVRRAGGRARPGRPDRADPRAAAASWWTTSSTSSRTTSCRSRRGGRTRSPVGSRAAPTLGLEDPEPADSPPTVRIGANRRRRPRARELRRWPGEAAICFARWAGRWSRSSWSSRSTSSCSGSCPEIRRRRGSVTLASTRRRSRSCACGSVSTSRS